MSHRIQVTLTDTQHVRLKDLARETGHTMSELVRRALDSTYESNAIAKRITALEASAGDWKDREFTSEEYVESLRHGLASRISERE